MLHIHGGDIVLDRIERVGIPGERLNWKEVLCEGPTPAGLTTEQWRRLRSAFLQDAAGPTATEAVRQLKEQDERLDLGLMEHDEIVLWFSSDWFCQAILLNLCWRIHRRPRRRARLSLVAPSTWPGIPEALGCMLSHIPETALPQVFEQRVELTPALLHTASAAWDAIEAPEPDEVAALASRSFPELPALSTGLRIHLSEFPAPGTGLSLSEEQVIDALDADARPWRNAFGDFKRREQNPWITDSMFVHRLRRLSSGEMPLVERSPDGGRVSRTVLGGEVLAGRRDWCALNPPDRWVGGVHLTATNLWRVNRSSLTVSRG
jgi:hypothetical protein